ncbi:MAG: SdrD B-like domain-containing protein, partial [Bacteroidota bacterium]
NFAANNPLEDKLSAEGVDSGDVDDNATNSDNGQDDPNPEINGIQSGDITLQVGSEPTGEGGQDTPAAQESSLPDASVNETVDFTFVNEKVALGNFVFMDTNEDSDYDDGTDMPVQGVLMELFESGDDPQSATPVDMTTTNANGYYYFDNLEPGDYFVYIQEENFQANGALENKLSSSGVSDPDDDTTDDDDNGIDDPDPSTNGISSPVVTLSPGDEPIDEAGQGGDDGTYPGTLPDENVNETVDFSFESEKVALGNLVFMDTNSDGDFDSGIDMGIDGVTVQLFRAGEDPLTTIPTDLDVTSGGGFYLFDQLDAGEYFVYIPASEFGVGGDLEDKVSSDPEGADDTTDDDSDENGENTPVGGGTKSGTIDLQPNNEPTGESGAGTYTGTLDDDNVNLTVDMGFENVPEEKVALGNLVFMDTNDDGDFDSGVDMGIDGVTVQLFKAGEDPLTTIPTALDVTSGGGFYLFDQLDPGEYFVYIPASEFGTGGDLEDKVSSDPEGDDDTTDDDSDENGENTPVGGGTKSGTIDLQPNNEPTGESGTGTYPGTLDDDNVNLTVDMGFTTEKVALGNLVYMDNDEDGEFDAGIDMGIDNVTIELYNQGDDPSSATPVATDVTENGGFYLFDNLEEGTYFVFIPADNF